MIRRRMYEPLFRGVQRTGQKTKICIIITILMKKMRIVFGVPPIIYYTRYSCCLLV